MQDSLWLIALANFSLLLVVLSILLGWQLFKVKKIIQKQIKSAENSRLSYVDNCIEEAQVCLDRLGDVNAEDILQQQLTKRHILAFRKQVMLAEKLGMTATDQSKADEVVLQAYYQQLYHLQQACKTVLDKQGSSFQDHLVAQLDCITLQEKRYGQVSLNHIAINDLSRQAVLALRKAIFSIEEKLLKTQLPANQYDEALFSQYRQLFSSIVMPEQVCLTGENKYANSYAKLVIEQYLHELQANEKRIESLERQQVLNESTLNECVNIKLAEGDDVKHLKIIAQYNELLEDSQKRVTLLENMLKAKNTTINHLKIKSAKLQQNTECVLEEVLQDDLSMRKMQQDYFEEVSLLNKEINTLKEENQLLEQKLVAKGVVLHKVELQHELDYKKSYEGVIDKLTLINREYHQLETMYMELLKKTERKEA